MNYIELINWFWELDETWQFTCCETRLYFYLVKTANRLGWENNWTHSDVKTAANVGVSANSLKTARNRLIQAGFIKVVIGGKSHGDKSRYQILTPNLYPNLIPKPYPNLYPNLIPKTSEHPIKSNSPDRAKLNQTKQEEKKEIFDEFRKIYPGKKRGNETEFENFCKKHKDWESVINLLKPAIESQITDIEVKVKSSKWVPEWANLQTWINQRRWEIIINQEQNTNTDKPQKMVYMDPLTGEWKPLNQK
jgi:hypothetical protein